MRTILTPCIALAAVAGTASAQTFSVLAWYGQDYPSLPGGGHLFSAFTPDVNIAADGSVAFSAVLLQAGIFRITPAGPVAIAMVGTPAPDSGGYNFSAFLPPHAIPGGAVFRAGLRATGLPDAAAVYLSDETGLHLCLLDGVPVPGHPGLIVRYSSDFASDGSQVTILAATGPNATSTSGSGLWQGVPGAMNLLAHTGDHAIGMPAGRTFINFYSAPALGPVGTAVFDATANGNYDGLWSAAPTAILRQAGDPIPTIPGATFQYLWSPVVNTRGDTLFSGTINDGALHEALWVASGSSLAILARQGDPAPGTAASFDTLGPYSYPTNTVLSDSGLAIFESTLTGPGISSSNNHGIWAGRPGDVHLVARTGDPAPGFPAGSTYTAFAIGIGQSQFAADNQGNVAFHAVVNGNLNCLMVNDLRGHVYPLLAPNLPIHLDSTPNETIVSYGFTSYAGNPASGRVSFMNASGQIAAYLRTVAPGVQRESIVRITLPPPCYANCDLSLTPPILNVNDFTCFLNRFAASDTYANCDGSTTPPVLNVLDFGCFLNAFVAGCP